MRRRDEIGDDERYLTDVERGRIVNATLHGGADAVAVGIRRGGGNRVGILVDGQHARDAEPCERDREDPRARSEIQRLARSGEGSARLQLAEGGRGDLSAAAACRLPLVGARHETPP